MSQTCNSCLAELEDGLKFCPHCGDKSPETRHAESIGVQAKYYAGEAADELWGAAKDAYSSGKHLLDKDSAKKVGAGAAIGAVASIVAPVGIVAGAAIGAGIVAYRHMNKKKKPEDKA